MKLNSALALFLAIACEKSTNNIPVKAFIAMCEEDGLDPLEQIKEEECDDTFNAAYLKLQEKIQYENNSLEEEWETLCAEIREKHKAACEEALVMGEDMPEEPTLPQEPKYRSLSIEDLLSMEGNILEEVSILSDTAKMFAEQLLLSTFSKYLESGYLEILKDGERYIRYNEMKQADKLRLGALLQFKATTQQEFVAEFLNKATKSYSNGETESDRLWSFIDYISSVEEALNQF